jgi:predicted CXXCH cytochrome family protein
VRISASSSFIHDSFGTNANSCRNCHIFHAAPADELLKTGPSQTQFCYLCHGNGAASSPYDVQGGVIAGMAESSAGGFDTVGGHVYNAVPVTSRHMVDGYVDNTSAFAAGSAALGFTGVIPGSNSKTVTADLVCSSCHNPHAGGASAPNPRLLRTVIMEVYDLYVTVDTQAVSDPDLLTGYQANRITGYRSGFNKWCSSCHDVLARATGSGHTADGSGLFRHATNVTATVYAPYNTTTGQGIPLEGATTSGNSSTGLVTCMTCHRSHGSTVQMSVFANRFERLDNAGGVADPVYSSALLRMDNRSVCYSCHGAAAFNIPVY